MTDHTKNPHFEPKKLEEERDKSSRIMTIRLNATEQAWIKEDKKILQQPKETTTLKQLAEIGHFVLHNDKIGVISRMIIQNRNRNKKAGIQIIE